MAASVQDSADGHSPVSRRAWYTVWLIALVTLLANIDRFVINLLAEPIKVDLGLTDIRLSLIIGTVFSISYLVTGLPMSRLSDSGNRKWILSGGLALWSLGTMACGLSRSFGQLLTARAVVGAAESVPGPASMSLISDLVPPRKLPRAFAIYQLGISFGQQASLLIGGILLGVFASVGHASADGIAPWQWVFLTCGVPGLLVWLLWATTVREPLRLNRRSDGSMSLTEVMAFLRARRALYVPLFLGIAVMSIEQFGMAAWRVSMFARTYGWAPSETGKLLGMTGLLIVPAMLLMGVWMAETVLKKHDRSAILRVPIMSYVLGLPLNFLAPLMPSPWLCFAMLAAATFIHGMAGPAINSAIQYATPNEVRAQISAIYLFTISVVGAAVGPLAVALVGDLIFRDEGMLRYAMSSFALMLGPLALLLIIRARGAYRRVMDGGFASA